MSLLTTKEIMEIIPHRHPFLLIDTIESLEPGVGAVGKKCVSGNEPFFAGHFPGNPVMPGALIIGCRCDAVSSRDEGKDSLFCGNRQGKVPQEGSSRRCAAVGDDHYQGKRARRSGQGGGHGRRQEGGRGGTDLCHRISKEMSRIDSMEEVERDSPGEGEL